MALFDGVASYSPNLDNRLKIVKLYVSSGAEINAQDWVGNTPLHYAKSSGIEPDNPAIIPFLENHGAIDP